MKALPANAPTIRFIVLCDFGRLKGQIVSAMFDGQRRKNHTGVVSGKINGKSYFDNKMEPGKPGDRAIIDR